MGARIDGQAAVRSIGVEEGRQRDGDPVVLALPQRLALALAHANDRVVVAVDADFFADGVIEPIWLSTMSGPMMATWLLCSSSMGAKPRPRSMLML